MRHLRRMLAKLEILFRRGHADRELDREVAAHLALLEDEFQRRGMSVVVAQYSPPSGGGSSSCSGDLNSGCSQVTGLSHVTNGSLANSGLANSSMTIAGHSIALGATQAIACEDLSNAGSGCAGSSGASIATPGTYANLPSTCSPNGSNALFIATDAPYTLICTGTNAQTAFFGGVGGKQVTVPPSSGWTGDNSPTIDWTHGYGYFTGASSSGSEALRFVYRTAPSAPYTVQALIQIDLNDIAHNETVNSGLSVGFRDSTGKIVESDLTIAGGAWIGEILKYTSSTSFSAAYSDTIQGTGTNIATIAAHPLWLQWKDDSTNLSFWNSIDGNNFIQIGANHSRTDFFASGPTQIGFGARTKTGNVNLAIYSWTAQ